MEKPSTKWRNVRRAAIERVHRTAIEPLEPLLTIYAAVCFCYLAGFLRFQFFEPTEGFTWIVVVQLSIVVVAGALVPLLTGSVLTLYFARRRIQRLVNE